jgi:hypothetical protein
MDIMAGTVNLKKTRGSLMNRPPILLVDSEDSGGFESSVPHSQDATQVAFITLLAQLCALQDPTPKLFVQNCIRLSLGYFFEPTKHVCRFYQIGILKSLSFLEDLGLLPRNWSLQAPSQEQLNSMLVVRPRSPRFSLGKGLDGETLDSSYLAGVEKLSNSRYEREFEELGAVGKGGFGTVFRARHRLDKMEYGGSTFLLMQCLNCY